MNPAFHINLIGHIWSGHRAAYSYSVATMPDETAVSALAGDFQSIIDYAVVKVTRGGDWEHEWTKREIVKNWANPDSPDEYGDLTRGAA